jgi:hypothetical protein
MPSPTAAGFRCTYVVLAENQLAKALHGNRVVEGTGLRASMAWQWFTDPGARDAAPEAERDEHSRTIVADLRAAWARRRNDADMRELVEGLLEHSSEFAELWARHEVSVRRMRRKTFLTRVGAITLDCEVLATTDGQHLVVLAPTPGSSALEMLRLLDVVGDQAVGSA